MSKREILAGATDQTIDVFIQDSSSTTGGGLTGLVFNSAGLTCYYRKGATGTPTALTLATQTVGGAHSDGGFVAVDGMNCPGQYRLDLSDTIVATAGMVTLYLRGATNMAPCVVEIEVVSVNKFDSVRMGLTALPNIASGSEGAIITSGTGTAQLKVTSGIVDLPAITTGWLTAAGIAADAITDAKVASDVTIASVTGSVGSVTGAVGSVTGAVGSVTGNVGGNVTGSVGSVATGGITAASFAAGAINAAAIAADAIGASELAADAVTEIQSGLATSAAVSTLQTDVTTLLGRITSNLFSGITSLAQWLGLIAGKQSGNATARTELRATGAGSGTYDETTDSQEALRDRGDAAWITATGFSTHTAADVWASGTRTLTAGTNIVLAKGVGVTGFTDLDAAGVRSAVGLASANLDTQLAALPTAASITTAVLTTQMTEAYAADGVAPTLAQCQFLVLAALTEFAISGTTITVKKLDGSTTAATYTLDSSTVPTSRTRAT